MMIRNIPARCQEQELSDVIGMVTTNFDLQMPKGAGRKCKGYAFVQADSVTMQHLVKALWMTTIPARQSTRPLKIHPTSLGME